MTTLTIETYGRILANILCRRRAPLAEVLADLGVDPAELERDEPGLRHELTDAWPSRRGILAMKFATALGAELNRLGPLGGDGAGPPAPEVVQLLADAPEVRETAMPSFLQASLAADRGGTGASPFLVPPAVAFSPIGPQITPPALVPKEPASTSSLAGTANLDLSAIVAAVQQRGLPFAHTQASAEGSPAAPEPRPSAESRSPRFGTGTVGTDLSAIVAAVQQGAHPFARSETSDSRHAGTGEEPDLALLPLETFAVVSGALARGESRDAALARHGLTSAAFDALATAWSQRFQREPQLLERFKELARSSAAMGRGGDGQR